MLVIAIFRKPRWARSHAGTVSLNGGIKCAFARKNLAGLTRLPEIISR